VKLEQMGLTHSRMFISFKPFPLEGLPDKAVEVVLFFSKGNDSLLSVEI